MPPNGPQGQPRRPMVGNQQLWRAVAFAIAWLFLACSGCCVGWISAVGVTMTSPEGDPTPGKSLAMTAGIFVWATALYACFFGFVWSLLRFFQLRSWSKPPTTKWWRVFSAENVATALIVIASIVLALTFIFGGAIIADVNSRQ
jgi:hypothetical protein